ncbi:hypothetical protein WCX18_09205 [Sulfurimonas sp. HSL1-2]|uniref:hypothetical protein n=1 Tax=Thiomicrolovo zhangzhouensis TaxID=3131933 RepID=UPI0031F767C5
MKIVTSEQTVTLNDGDNIISVKIGNGQAGVASFFLDGHLLFKKKMDDTNYLLKDHPLGTKTALAGKILTIRAFVIDIVSESNYTSVICTFNGSEVVRSEGDVETDGDMIEHRTVLHFV